MQAGVVPRSYAIQVFDGIYPDPCLPVGVRVEYISLFVYTPGYAGARVPEVNWYPRTR